MKATLNKSGKDDEGHAAVSIRVAAGATEILIFKDGEDPSWYLLGPDNGQARLVPTSSD